MHAATARVGVATADLYPKFIVSGTLGWSAGNFGSLFNSHSLGWSFGPLFSWPIFSSGRIRSNIELQKALTDESVIVCQQTVLNALQEVQSALIASDKEQEHRKAIAEAVTANRQAVDLATKLYTEGQSDFLSVLDAQRSLYASEDALSQSTGTVSTNLIALYKSLGGGWQDDEAAAATKLRQPVGFRSRRSTYSGGRAFCPQHPGGLENPPGLSPSVPTLRKPTYGLTEALGYAMFIGHRLAGKANRGGGAWLSI